MTTIFDELFRQLDACADPTNPVHMQARQNIAKWRELSARSRTFAAEAHQLLDAGNLEAALPLIEEYQVLTAEIAELAERARQLSLQLHPGTARVQ